MFPLLALRNFVDDELMTRLARFSSKLQLIKILISSFCHHLYLSRDDGKLTNGYLGEHKIGGRGRWWQWKFAEKLPIDYAVRLEKGTAIVASEVEYCNTAEGDL